jgi:hypothetical protein
MKPGWWLREDWPQLPASANKTLTSVEESRRENFSLLTDRGRQIDQNEPITWSLVTVPANLKIAARVVLPRARPMVRSIVAENNIMTLL